MIWDRLVNWLDNPILVKHTRSRLRPQAFFSWLAVVVMLCICILWAGYQLDMFISGGAVGWLLALQTLILVIIGAAQVNGSVNGARASGILDFHRVSPMTPTELTLGFFFGAPIREYLLFAATLPCLAVCMAFGLPSPRAALQLMIMLVTTAWCFHGLSMLNGLISRGKNTTGSVVGVIVVLMILITNVVGRGGWFSVNMAEGETRFSFFGMSLPWLPVVLLYQLPVLFFMLLASTRKMQSARLHPLSKPEAIAAMVTFGALVLGGIWRQENYDVLEVWALYLLTIPAILLALMVTPNQAEYYKGLWRAQKQGRARLPWWDDFSVNWVTIAIIAGTVLAAGTIAWSVPGAPSPSFGGDRRGSFPLALATAVLVVAYFGLSLQYFLLRFAGRGTAYFALFLFVAWFLPLVAGWIQMASSGPFYGSSSGAGYPFFALSPIAAIGMVANIGDEAIATSIQSCGITPALLFAFVFNYLLIGARKRVMKAVYVAAANRKQVQDEAVPGGPIPDGRIRDQAGTQEPVA